MPLSSFYRRYGNPGPLRMLVPAWKKPTLNRSQWFMSPGHSQQALWTCFSAKWSSKDPVDQFRTPSSTTRPTGQHLESSDLGNRQLTVGWAPVLPHGHAGFGGLWALGVMWHHGVGERRMAHLGLPQPQEQACRNGLAFLRSPL